MLKLEDKYKNEVVPKLIKEFGIKNVMQTPKIKKVVVNAGVGDAQKSKEVLERMKEDLASITGQNPSVRNARVSVASFGLRKGSPVGLKVTLGRLRMYDFLDRLFSVVLPRLRDFRGVKRGSFDKHGNYTLGIAEHNIFPEIDITKSIPRGLEITIVIKSESVEQSYRLLELMGMPFEKRDEK